MSCKQNEGKETNGEREEKKNEIRRPKSNIMIFLAITMSGKMRETLQRINGFSQFLSLHLVSRDNWYCIAFHRVRTRSRTFSSLEFII